MKQKTEAPDYVGAMGATWMVTVHRWQPKTGKHRNQSWELAGDSDEGLSSTMEMAFGDESPTRVPFDLVARTHAVTRISIDSSRREIHIWTAPTVIRPYRDKVAKDFTETTARMYAPSSFEVRHNLRDADDDVRQMFEKLVEEAD